MLMNHKNLKISLFMIRAYCQTNSEQNKISMPKMYLLKYFIFISYLVSGVSKVTSPTEEKSPPIEGIFIQ